MTIKYECLECKHRFNTPRPYDGYVDENGEPYLKCPKGCTGKYFKWHNFNEFMKKASKELKQIYNGS